MTHQGPGFIDVFDSRWSSEQSESVYHITLAGTEKLEDVQRKMMPLVFPEGNSEQRPLSVLPIEMGTTRASAKLVELPLNTTLADVCHDFPLRCLWLVVWPSRESARRIFREPG